MTLRFHHIGVACEKLGPEIDAHTLLGYHQEGDVFVDPAQRIRGVFMTNGGARVELLEPAGADSPLRPFLQRGQKMYHQAFQTDAIEDEFARLVDAGAIARVAPIPAVAFDGRRIAFLMLRTLLLVELIEAPREDSHP
jgi:methylmalonyl-CoA/ethylmalonyl-CoA epimerase